MAGPAAAYLLLGPLATLGRFFVGLFTSFKGWFAFWFVTNIGDLAITALSAVGAGYVTYELGGFALDALYSQISTNVGGMPEMLLTSFRTLGVFDAVSVIFGGMAAKMALSGVFSGLRRSKMAMSKPENWVS